MKQCCECHREIAISRKNLCNNCYRKKYLGHNCLDCGIRIYAVSRRCKKCDEINRKGKPNLKNLKEKNGRWKGGVRNKLGYKEVMVGVQKYKFEHRMIVEKNIGRKLLPNEVVHHINGDKSDNRIENLLVFKNNQEHLHYHYLLRHNLLQ